MIYLRTPLPADANEFVAAALVSRKLHHPWTTAPSTPAKFRAYAERMSQPGNEGFLICLRETDQIVGVVNVTNIIMGQFRSAYLGYYAFACYEGRGLMREGLQAVIRHAFRKLKLHRLEANIQPDNVRSIGLVKACGFVREGYSPRYLKIGGRWRDHERWAILAS